MLAAPRTESVLWHLFAAVVIGVAAASFVHPALALTGGTWPAPLDDTYIYFGCARSFAEGAPFAWYPGNGYGSGCTSALYPMLLAPLWAVGLRGSALGVGAFVIALLCLGDLARSLRRVAEEHPASWLFPLLVVAVPVLSWSWFSGMETALAGAVIGRALLACRRALGAHPDGRRGAQRRAGYWLAGALLTRPELLPFALACAVALAYRGGALSALGSLVRVGGPGVTALVVQASANRLFTGEWAQAGGIRKALWSSPFATDGDVAIAWLSNLVVLVDQALVRGLGGTWLAYAFPALVLAAVALPRHRAVALPALLGAVGALAVVCLNATARYQNYRYAAPTLVLLLVTAALGVDALARVRAARVGWGAPLALALSALAALAPATQRLAQTEHFARASANIVEQHVEVARRLRALEPPARRVMVNDAGVIPYLADVPPLDGLGLGGFRGLPFARASVHGQPAVVELIERLPPDERPDVMALYAPWWGETVDRFGTRIDAVRIEHNVICGHDEVVLYRADWSLLGPAATSRGAAADALDAVDVADLVSERAHAFRFPAPRGGWVVGDARTDARGVMRYDGGRSLPARERASFVVAAGVAKGPVSLRVRTDREVRLGARVVRAGRVVGVASTATEPRVAVAGGTEPGPPRWYEPTLALPDVRGGDRIELEGESAWHLHHLWLRRDAAAAPP